MMDNNKERISVLINKYNYLSQKDLIKTYNEAQTRNEFIEPLFEYLGWDMRNISMSNEVTTEESVSKGRVDLAFRIGSVPVMFLEAKAMRVDLDQWKWAEQAINYSWNKGVTWAVLSDFESLKIFNSEIPPKSLRENLFFEINYSEYIERYGQLWLLSKESFEKNKLTEQAEAWGKLSRRKHVSESLFEDLLHWRELLTTNLKSSQKFNESQIAEGVQKILDRLIFIRTAEDRNIEANVLLETLNSQKNGIYQKVVKIFREFDESFNSKLFAQHFCEHWHFDDGVMQEMLSGLYGTKDGFRYDFSAIGADVLGGIYEQYLSCLQNQAGVSAKSSKRKTQGIFYTPEHIAKYIVNESLGTILREQNREKRKSIKILDLTCGSGSFLTAAYDLLLAHEDKPELFTKFNILQENIFGVDLDDQAVEIAKLNLLLRVLSQKALLPTLKENIHVGNSLLEKDEIISDYFSDEEIEKSMAFNFDKYFPNIMKNGGFDVIIGNPPYIFSRNQKFNNKNNNYLKNKYILGKNQLNTYVLFIERAYNLLKPDGRLGFIIPNTWLTVETLRHLRKFLLAKTGALKIINIKDKIFANANVDTCLLFFQKSKPGTVLLGEMENQELRVIAEVPLSHFDGIGSIINLSSAGNETCKKILQTIGENSLPLSNFAKVSTGIKSYQIGKGKPSQDSLIKQERAFHSLDQKDETYKKYLEGRDVGRYKLGWSEEYIAYGPWLAEPRRSVPFSGPRILVRQIPSKPPHSINAVFTSDEYVHDINSMVVFDIDCDPLFVLAVLNSSIMTYWFVHRYDKFQRKIFPQFKVGELASFPIPKATVEQQNAVALKATKLLMLNHEMVSNPLGGSDFDRAKREIDALEKDIDTLVCGLFGLDPEPNVLQADQL